MLNWFYIEFRNEFCDRGTISRLGCTKRLILSMAHTAVHTYGHVSRSSGLAKTILQATVRRGRRQGRQTKRWEDNIKETTGLEFAKSQRAVENR